MRKITRDASWAEPNMRKYFKRMENNQYPISSLMSPNNGFSGWFKTSYISFLDQLKLDPMLVNYVLATVGNPLRNINDYGLLGKLNTDSDGRVFIPQAVDKLHKNQLSKVHPPCRQALPLDDMDRHLCNQSAV
ncbi:hypothetical protein DSO57_1000979 [Entomophthora muscae]|uniref:Uncharacterized protein n=1 Tax=Entomophthora muscae TaxID=34485 RepID=A0ACC2UIY1_9FUNG|nr:hypothetical protein DSO57_1000979 [Entomophthora muscae]